MRCEATTAERLAEIRAAIEATSRSPARPTAASHRSRQADAVERSELQRNHCGLSRILAAALEAALALRRSGAAPKALRRAPRRIEELLDE